MDAIDPGKPSPLLGRLRALALRSPVELWAYMGRLDYATLCSLIPHLPADCACPVAFRPCPDHPGEDCDCAVVAEPCPHLAAARDRDWSLPAAAVAWLLLWRDPKQYAEPPPPAEPSRNTGRDAQVAVMADRRRRRRALRHPLDWIRLGVEGVDERLTRSLRRARNGADVVGPLALEGDSHA